jgi:hypothetical protein
MLHGYLSTRRKKAAKFFWDDLLPIVKSFYTSLWNQERPAVMLPPSAARCVGLCFFDLGTYTWGGVVGC